MPHELPSPRRFSSPGQASPGDGPNHPRPLSASFLTNLDPLTPSRHSTLHLYPQNIFPSKLNKLDSRRLEIPYVFSHDKVAFHWTKEDALANLKLNIWARPPCVNCEVAGGDIARRCNRYERQEASSGGITSCARCERRGDGLCCVEQIEVRADCKYGPLGPNSVLEFRQWSEEEETLRRIGIVQWQPINLNVGDIDRKARIVQQYRNHKVQSQRALPQPTISSGKASWKQESAAKKELEQKMRFGLRRMQSLVAEWDEEDLYLEQSRLAQESHDSVDIKIAKTNTTGSAIDIDSIDRLAENRQYWCQRIGEEIDRKCLEELKEVGPEVADMFKQIWETARPKIITETCYFLEQKLGRVQNGMDEDDATALGKALLSDEAADHLETLVPEIFQRSS